MERSAHTNTLRRLQLGPVKIAYTDEGIGDSILCIHGSWDDHHSWGSVAALLREEYRVVTYDRRGHGASTAPPGQGHVSDDVNDALELMDKLDLAPAHIAGHSYGANIALALAIRSPASTRSLFVHEPPLFSLLKGSVELEELRGEALALMTRTAQLIEKGDIEKGAKLFIEEVAFGAGSWEHLFNAAARAAILSNVDTWLDQFHDPERLAIDICALRDYSRSITVSTGLNTLPSYRQVVKQMIAMVPAIEVATIAGGGHGAHISHPTEIASVMRAHLAA